MHIQLLIIINVIVAVLCREMYINIQQYCNLPCQIRGAIHTICQYRCQLSPDCHDFQEYELDYAERQFILDVHNYYRSRVAGGHDRRGGNGPARDMLALSYDEEMELPVACWARRCIFEHDKCRQTPKYRTAGQNLFLESTSLLRNPKNTYYLNISVTDWYNEIQYTNPRVIQRFYVPRGRMVGHFTQVVWANTAYLACTRVTYTYPTEPVLKYHLHLLCNYAPSGNILTLRVYEYGSGCSYYLTPDPIFTGLCMTSDALMKRQRNDRTIEHKAHMIKKITASPPREEKDTTPRNRLIKMRSCETTMQCNKDLLYLLMLLFILLNTY